MTADFSPDGSSGCSSNLAADRAADFARVRFVMTAPSLPANVGSAARAIKTMGFTELVLVAPKISDAARHPEAIALASGATDVLAAAQTVALADYVVQFLREHTAGSVISNDLYTPV